MVNCDCGVELAGEDDDELYRAAYRHFEQMHPDPGSLGQTDEDVRQLIRTRARDQDQDA